MAIFNCNTSVNRKNNKCTFKRLDNYHFPMEDKLIQYLESIHFDYGRIELINDTKLGWCIIDVNNSPGDGPLTSLIYKQFAELMFTIINS